MRAFDANSEITAIPAERYTFAPPHVASQKGQTIVLEQENEAASRYIRMNRDYLRKQKYQLVIVPGFTPLDGAGKSDISATARERLNMAVERFSGMKLPVIMVSGGNVHPAKTPLNEAFGMKQYLVSHLGLKPENVAIDPYARHSTTNLRNCGRFMLRHSLERALIITSYDQNFYYGFSKLSTFGMRCMQSLGYLPGNLKWKGVHESLFEPSEAVFTKGNDPLDP